MSVGRRAGGAALAAAALAVGGLVSQVAPPDEFADAPFVRTGGVGDTVVTEFADVTVTDVSATDDLGDLGPDLAPAVAAGAWLVVDVDLLARDHAVLFAGAYLRDAEGRLHATGDRSDTSGCDETPDAPTGRTLAARICFDVPRSAFAGATLVLARAPYNEELSWRRDEVVEVDLGIDDATADKLWGKP